MSAYEGEEQHAFPGTGHGGPRLIMLDINKGIA